MNRLKQKHRPILVKYVERKEKDGSELEGYINLMKDRDEETTLFYIHTCYSSLRPRS